MRAAQLAPLHVSYGPFLLGCWLVDVNAFGRIDRQVTHLVTRQPEGDRPFDRSCAIFLRERDCLLQRPWRALREPERAFLAGYLCHLAADETWKAFAWRVFQTLDAASWTEFPIPLGVVLTAFSVSSVPAFADLSAVASALDDVTVPDVLTHIPHAELRRVWDVSRPHARDPGRPDSYLSMLEHMGRSEAQVRQARRAHETHWDEALALIETVGGVEPRIDDAVARSLEILPRLWDARPAL
jgi:hypothetical protein